MDYVANSLGAYTAFCAPRETEPVARSYRSASPEGSSAKRAWPIGWMVGGFYGLILGALMLGVTANIDGRQIVRACPVLLATLMATQGLLVARRRAPIALRIAQGLTTPALGLAAATLGGLARLQD